MGQCFPRHCFTGDWLSLIDVGAREVEPDRSVCGIKGDATTQRRAGLLEAVLLPSHEAEVQQDRGKIGRSRKSPLVERSRFFVLTAGKPAVACDVEQIRVVWASGERRLDDGLCVVDLTAAEMGGGHVAGLDDRER